MTRGYAQAVTQGKSSGAFQFGESRTPVRLVDQISRLARGLWPRNTAAELAARADVTVRNAEHWLGGRSGLSGEALADLLCSDAGLEILEGIMERRASKPDWWKRFKRQASIAAARREIETARARLAQLEAAE